MYTEAITGLCICYIYLFISRLLQNQAFRHTKYAIEITSKSKESYQKIIQFIVDENCKIIKNNWIETHTGKVLIEVQYVIKKKRNRAFLNRLSNLESNTGIKDLN